MYTLEGQQEWREDQIKLQKNNSGGTRPVPGTRVSGTRFRFAGSITRIGNVILINYDEM